MPPEKPATMDFTKATIREVLEYFFQTSDADAFAEFWSRVRPVIRGRCASILQRQNSDELLDDFEQEAYLKLSANDYKVLRQFKWPDEGSIFKYMKVVAASVVIDWCRKNRRMIFLDPEDLELVTDHSFSGHRTAELEMLRQQIDKILRTCVSGENVERDMAIFWLYYRQGLRAREIANLPSIKLPVHTVENILQDLARRVRKKLGEAGKGTSPD